MEPGLSSPQCEATVRRTLGEANCNSYAGANAARHYESVARRFSEIELTNRGSTFADPPRKLMLQ